LIARALGDRSAGVEPLDVLLTAMREAWNEGDVEAAVVIAEKAAPYRHPKLASTELKGDADNPIEQHSRVEMVIVDAQHDTSFGAEEAGAFAQTRPI